MKVTLLILLLSILNLPGGDYTFIKSIETKADYFTTDQFGNIF